MTFELQYTDSKTNARAGLITTDHGQIETPIFMPVGTLGTVKGVHLTELKEDIKAQIILGKRFHCIYSRRICASLWSGKSKLSAERIGGGCYYHEYG